MSKLQTPILESYWVVPGKFLAGEYPLHKDVEESTRRIAGFLDAGIDTFIDLTEAGELIPYEPFLRGHAITCHRFAIGDYGLPSKEKMTTILDTIDAALATGHKVYVHCWGGVGRTGTTVGCYLVRHGMTGSQALGQLAHWWRNVPKSARFPRSPETDAQVKFILDWKN